MKEKFDRPNPLELSLEYDKLVIAIGASNNTFNIPGVLENANFLKELSDARKLRNKIIENFERASLYRNDIEELRKLLHFVIVGGGPTGVEFAAELSDFFWEDLNKYFYEIPIYEVKITILEASDTILSAFDQTIVNRIIKNISKHGIHLRTHSIVKEVQKDRVILKDGSEIKCGLVLWCTGVGPRKLVEDLKIPKSKNGRILVNDHLQVQGLEDVYAIGDCAEIVDNPLPLTAQVAQQQGNYLALSFNKNINKPFVFKFLGVMVYTGAHKSALDSKYWTGHGFISWIAWRSVYLTRLGTWRNKFQVPFDWFRTLLFGRDVTHFD